MTINMFPEDKFVLFLSSHSLLCLRQSIFYLLHLRHLVKVTENSFTMLEKLFWFISLSFSEAMILYLKQSTPAPISFRKTPSPCSPPSHSPLPSLRVFFFLALPLRVGFPGAASLALGCVPTLPFGWGAVTNSSSFPGFQPGHPAWLISSGEPFLSLSHAFWIMSPFPSS